MTALKEIPTPESAHGRASKGRMTVLATLLSLLCLTGTAAKAEDSHRPLPIAREAHTTVETSKDSITVRLLFPISKSEIDAGFEGNGELIAEFTKRLREIGADSTRRITGITVVGFASPEGGYRHNRRLARERAQRLADYLRGSGCVADTLISVRDGGIDWEGLDRALSMSAIPEATQAQYIIRHEPEFTYDASGRLIRSRKQQLMNHNRGDTWRRMLREIFPTLRSSASVVCFIESAAISQPLPETQPTTVVEAPATTVALKEGKPLSTSATTAPQPEPERLPRYPVAALRSNLLLPLLNVGIEVPVAEHWSVGADYYYPWLWPAKSNKNCFELIFISAEARYWFNARGEVAGKNYLTGHSVAAYGAWGYYDFERNYHGHQGHGWSAGVDYVYALSVAKGRLRIEFQLAVGAVWSPKAQPYNVYERGGVLIREKGHRKDFSYFGPTKVSVSIVVPLFRKVKPATPPMP